MKNMFTYTITTNARRGFTLIEMMVVIGIIGILVAAIYANFSAARKQSRDKVRVAQLEELRVAIELYKDKYGLYPETGCGTFGSNSWAGPTNQTPSAWNAQCDNYIEGQTGRKFVPEFIKSLPKDMTVTGAADSSGIYYASNGVDYKLLQYQNVEALYVDSFAHPFNRYHETCTGALVYPTTYAIYSTGALCW